MGTAEAGRRCSAPSQGLSQAAAGTSTADATQNWQVNALEGAVNALEGGHCYAEHSFSPPWVTAAPVTYGCKKKGAAGLLEQCPEPPKPVIAPACWQLPCPKGEGPCAQRDRGQQRRGLQVGRTSPDTLWRGAQLSMWFKQLLLKCLWPDEHQRVHRLTEIIPFLCVQCMGGRWLCERPAEVRTEVCHGKHVPAVTVG